MLHIAFLKTVTNPLTATVAFIQGAASAAWTFPSVLGSAMLIAWGAEAAQFLISQGLALAILAWLQTLPEFAVEAVIAWEAGNDPLQCFVASPPPGCVSHLAIANYTGAIRLLIGLGWPMIYFVSAWGRRRTGRTFAPIRLVDAAVLVAMYVAYLFVLWRFPPENEESLAEAPRVSRWAYTRPGKWRYVAIGGLFVV